MLKFAGSWRSKDGMFALIEGCGKCCNNKRALLFLEKVKVGGGREVEIPLTQEQFDQLKMFVEEKP